MTDTNDPTAPVQPAPSAVPALPVGSNTINPFLFTEDAATLISFLIEVFDASEVMEARTTDTDGLVLHSELRIGDSVLVVADRKPNWPFTPAFTQVYVDDVDAVLTRAKALGAEIVTNPTEFWGDTLSRFADPRGNLWWVQRHVASEDAVWDAVLPEGAETWESFTTPELEYIHSTLMEAMARLRDPRS